MSENQRRVRRSLAAALLASASTLTAVLGCQSIADIPDVSYSAVCNDYCDLEFKVCPGLFGQYDDPQTCLETCVALDKAADGSPLTTGNTVPCRLKNLKLAQQLQDAPTDLQQACTRGGPGGGDTCTLAPKTPDCEGYCAIYRDACSGDSTNPFVSLGLDNDSAGTQSECIAKCQGIPGMPKPGYTWQSGKNSGDTLGCRLYYATRAVADPKNNCDLAGIRPSGACRDEDPDPSCPNFCLALTTACQGDLAVYESQDQCEAVCKATSPGEKDSIETVDTVACRTAHAFNALLVKASDHCPHTGPLGAGVCGAGGNCEAFCALAKVACPTVYKTNFPRDGQCEEDCADLGGAKDGGYSVKEGSKGGATVQCRGLAVSRVLELPVAERTPEACAPVFGGDPCSD
ncbi:MAG TPA: hypothetical protein VHM25_16850 [Polyangiaceae bacterium]|jgi:hypothetical protein|nr:hypothetical protein [Polyangiaceae bacterium]